MVNQAVRTSRNRKKPAPIHAKPVKPEEFEGLETELCGVKMRAPFAVGEMSGFGGDNWKMSPEEQAAEYLRWVEAGVGWLAITNIMGTSPPNIRETVIEKSRKLTEEESTPRWIKKGLPRPSYPNFLYSWQGLGGLYGVAMMRHGHPVGRTGRPSGSVWPTSPGERKQKKERLQRIIDIVKAKKAANVPLLFTVSGLGALPEDFVESAKMAEELGADLINLNSTCPMGCCYEDYPKWCRERSWPAHGMAAAHMAISTPGVGDIIAKAVVESVHVPVGVKFAPEICTFPLIVETAKMYEKVGARFITTMNSSCAVIPPDIYNHGKPAIDWDRNSIVGMQGPYALPHQYLAIAALRHYVPGMEILAVGGITTPENVVECLMLGARTTAQVTAVLTRGLDVIRQNVHFLHKFLKDQGYKDVKELIGIHEQYFGGQENIAGKENVTYLGATDYEKCNGCGVCADLPGMASLCRHMDPNSGLVVVDESRCNSCGSCVIACPWDACYMKKVAL